MKKIIGSSLVVTFIVSLALFGSTSGESPNKNFIVFGKQIASNSSNQESIGKVNGEPIDANEVNNYQFFLETIQAEPNARQKAINKIVEDTLLFQEAKKRNLAISVEAAKAFAKDQRDILDSNKSENAQEVKEMIQYLIEGLGISEEEYWNDYVVKGYLKENSIGLLQYKVTEDANSAEDKKEKWNNFLKELKKSAKIELK